VGESNETSGHRVELSAPLRRPAFRRLAFSFTINEFGDWLGIVALSVLVFDRTDSALATMALFLGMRFVPALLSPALVARVERTPPRFMLAALYCFEAAAFGVLALLVDNFALAAVVAVAMVDGTLALCGRSLTRAVTAALLEPAGELRAGNAILNIGFTAVMFAGPLPHVEPEEGQWRDRFRAGLAYVTSRVPLRRLMVAQGAAFIFFTAVIPIEVIYAKSTLGSGDSGYGALLASWGVGMVAGSIVFGAVRSRGLPLLLLLSTIAIGVSYLFMAAAPNLLTACAAAALGGIGNGVEWVTIVSAIQEMTRQEMQARVMSVLESVGAAMPGVGFILGGLVATSHDPRAVFLVSGLGVLVVAAIATYYLAGTPWTKGAGTIGPADIDADVSDLAGSDNVDEPATAPYQGVAEGKERN
jgi:hypothetical protein